MVATENEWFQKLEQTKERRKKRTIKPLNFHGIEKVISFPNFETFAELCEHEHLMPNCPTRLLCAIGF